MWCRSSTAGPVRSAPADFERWCIAPTKRLVDAGARQASRRRGSSAFPRGAGKLDSLPMSRRRASTPSGSRPRSTAAFARDEIQSLVPVQGHLDPLVLRAGGPELEAEVAAIREAFGGRPFIFNLGHGILPDTPIPHVERLLAAVQTPETDADV